MIHNLGGKMKSMPSHLSSRELSLEKIFKIKILQAKSIRLLLSFFLFKFKILTYWKPQNFFHMRDRSR